MLVLARKSGESIVINDNIIVKILDVKNSSAKIGIEAPRSVSIYREEVVRQIELENQQAALTENIDLDQEYGKFFSDEEDTNE